MRWLVGLFVVALWAGAIVPLPGLVAQNSESTAAELPYEQTRGFEQSARVYEYAAATAPCALTGRCSAASPTSLRTTAESGAPSAFGPTAW